MGIVLGCGGQEVSILQVLQVIGAKSVVYYICIYTNERAPRVYLYIIL
jgi:hypothetical protein